MPLCECAEALRLHLALSTSALQWAHNHYPSVPFISLLHFIKIHNNLFRFRMPASSMHMHVNEHSCRWCVDILMQVCRQQFEVYFILCDSCDALWPSLSVNCSTHSRRLLQWVSALWTYRPVRAFHSVDFSSASMKKRDGDNESEMHLGIHSSCFPHTKRYDAERQSRFMWIVNGTRTETYTKRRE